MSTPAWTPGPWRAVRADDSYEDDAIPVKAANGFQVCDVYGWATSNHPAMTMAEAEANASLIAAAPKMAEALEDALLYVERDEEAHGRKFAVGNTIRAALAAARGEQP